MKAQMDLFTMSWMLDGGCFVHVEDGVERLNVDGLLGACKLSREEVSSCWNRKRERSVMYDTKHRYHDLMAKAD